MNRKQQVKGSEVLNIVRRHNQPICFSDIVQRVALERNVNPQDVEGNVMDTLNVGTRLGFVDKDGDYYCSKTHPMFFGMNDDESVQPVASAEQPEPGQKMSMPQAQPSAIIAQPDAELIQPESKHHVATSSPNLNGGAANCPAEQVDALGGSVFERKSRSRTRRHVKYDTEAPPMMPQQPSGSRKRNAGRSDRVGTASGKRMRNNSNPGAPSVCTTTCTLPRSVTRERIGDILHIAGIDRRTRAFRCAENLLCDEINEVIVHNEACACKPTSSSKARNTKAALLAKEPNSSRKTKAEQESGNDDDDSDEEDDNDEEQDQAEDTLRPGYHDSIFYSGCGHSSTAQALDKEAQMPSDMSDVDDDDDDDGDNDDEQVDGPGRRPFINPDDCPACQRRKRLAAASRKRRKSKGKGKKKSKSKRRR